MTDNAIDQRALRRWSERVDASGDCWEWTGPRTPTGYGRCYFRGNQVGAHRVAIELLVGPIPSHLEVDHLCRNRSCVNPDHLELVTHRENLRRSPALAVGKSHCPQGHPYSGENLNERMTPNGRTKKTCRVCDRAHNRRYRARQKEMVR